MRRGVEWIADLVKQLVMKRALIPAFSPREKETTWRTRGGVHGKGPKIELRRGFGPANLLAVCNMRPGF